jgi:uncharacterized membrane protein
MMAAYGMLFVGLAVLALCGGLLGLGLFAVRDVTHFGSEQAIASGGTRRALEVLTERYARGEITKEQYEHTRSDLLV